MEEWKEYKLGDICGLVPGFAFKSKDFGRGFDIAIKIKDIRPPYIETKDADAVDISQYDLKKLTKFLVHKGEFLLAMTGATIGKIGRYVNEEPAYVNQRVLIFKDIGSVSYDYLYYYLSTECFQLYVNNHVDSQSAQPNISSNTIGKYTIRVPSFQVQQHIASILKSIDNQIDLNRRINDNLEQQAQALFKSWFVDFEPFKNGEFVESELGRIPKGWCVGVYNDIISDTVSGDWGKEKEEGNYTHRVACVRGCDFQDIKNGLRGKTPERFILEKNFQNKHFCDKDMLVEISGGTASVSTGRVCPVSQQLIDKYDGDIVCTNFCKLVRPKTGYGAYLYYSWLNKYSNKVMFGYENGTSGIKNFRIKDFTSIEPVILPPIKMVEEFQNHIDSIQKQIQTRGSESHNLAQLRDTLLPRLMSGELKVNEI